MKKTLEDISKVYPLAESYLYNLMDRLTNNEYNGGRWVDCEPTPGVIYTKVSNKENERIVVYNYGLQAEVEVSYDAACIILNLHFWSRMSIKNISPELQEPIYNRFHNLRNWAQNHDEAAAIFLMID